MALRFSGTSTQGRCYVSQKRQSSLRRCLTRKGATECRVRCAAGPAPKSSRPRRRHATWRWSLSRCRRSQVPGGCVLVTGTDGVQSLCFGLRSARDVGSDATDPRDRSLAVAAPPHRTLLCRALTYLPAGRRTAAPAGGSGSQSARGRRRRPGYCSRSPSDCCSVQNALIRHCRRAPTLAPRPRWLPLVRSGHRRDMTGIGVRQQQRRAALRGSFRRAAVVLADHRFDRGDCPAPRFALRGPNAGPGADASLLFGG